MIENIDSANAGNDMSRLDCLGWIEELIDWSLRGQVAPHEVVVAIKKKLMEQRNKAGVLGEIEWTVNACLRRKITIDDCVKEVKRLLVRPSRSQIVRKILRNPHADKDPAWGEERHFAPARKPAKALQRKVLSELLREGRLPRGILRREIQKTGVRGGHSEIAINALKYRRGELPARHGDPFKFFWQGGLPQ